MPKQTFYEGQTATNPTTGDRIVYSKGKWAAAGTAAPPPRLAEGDEKYLNDLRTKATTTSRNAAEAERFLGINSTTPTGGMAGWPLIGGMVREQRAAHNPKFAELESISSAIAPTMRPPGSGSSSDTDVRMFQKGFVNTMNPYDANKQIAKRIRDESVFNSAHAAYVDAYARKTGALAGAEPAFQQYWSQNSPRLLGQGGGAPSSDGSITVQLPGGGTAIVRPR